MQPAPGGAAAHLAAAPPRYIYIGPFGDQARSLARDARIKRFARLARRNTTTPIYAALMDAELFPRLEGLSSVSRYRNFPARWQAARAAAAVPGNARARDVVDALRDGHAANGRPVGHRGTKKHAAMMFFGPDGEGFDEEETDEYIANNHFYDDLYEAIFVHRYRSVLPARFRVKIQIMYTVSQVAGGPAVPKTLMGPAVVDLPRLWLSTESTVTSDETLAEFCFDQQLGFSSYISQYLGGDGEHGSGYKFDRLVACYIWAITTNAPGNGGGILYGGRVKGTALWDGSTNPLPKVLWASHGLVQNWPDKKDSMCIARAVMSGLDMCHDASSGANIVNLARDALDGAQGMLRHAQRSAAKPCTSDVVRANRSAAVERAHAAVATAQGVLADATELVRSNPRRMIRTSDMKAARFHSTARFTTIEAQLGLALRGAHPLMDFRSDYWREAQTLSSETLSRLQAAVRPGAFVKFQLWAIGNNGSIGLAYADTTATFDFLLRGGILVNLLFADRHCSLIRSVSACCNHQVFVSDPSDARMRAGYTAHRSICDLCGHHVTSTHPGFKWRIFEHQRAGCARLPGPKLISATSPNNRRQLSRFQYTAKMRSLVVAVWDADPLFAVLDMRARVFSGWKPLQLSRFDVPGAKQWADMRTRYSHMHSAELPFVEPSLPHRSLQCVGEDSTRDFWFAFASKESVDEILAALHYCGPRNAASLAALLASDPDGSASNCYGCGLPVLGPSRWDMQEAEDVRRGALAEERDPDDADELDEAEFDPDAFEAASVASLAASYIPDPVKHVVHHCHATGECFYAHADCNSFMRQSTNALTIEVTTPDAMAAALEVIFSSEFIEGPLKGALPSLSEVDGDISRIVFKVQGSPRSLHRDEVARMRATAEAEGYAFNEAAAASTRVKRTLTVTLRPRKALLRGEDLVVFTPDTPSAAVRAAQHADELLQLSETEFAATSLWPPAFPTFISYSVGVLYSYAAFSLPPTVTPTSISNPLSFASAKALVTGGRIVMGEDVEWEPRPVEDRTRYRLYSDTTAAYPAQMIRWKLPCLEGDDRLVANFFECETPASALEFLAADDLAGDLVRRYEVWGAFPPELHAKYNALPPQYSRVTVVGDMLSAFQRVAMDKGRSYSFGDRVVGHFFPYAGNVVFSRELKLLVAMGFVVERIGRVFETPASFWGRSFALAMQTRRRAAKARGDALEEEAVKALSNSVIGALAKDPSKYKRLLTEKGYKPPSDSISALQSGAAGAAAGGAGAVAMDDDVLDADADSYEPDASTEAYLEAFAGRVSRAADDPRFTLRILRGGDCVFLEHSRASWVHSAHTLAFAFIQAMARIDLIVKVFGGEGQRGILDAFPTARIGYGCTDSLCVDLALTPEEIAAGQTDVRVKYFREFQHRVDASNIPATSSFWKAFSAEELPAVKAYVAEHAGEWGFDKDETCGAGILAMLVNGPNRWYLRVGQVDGDTPAKYWGAANQDVLKSLPKATKNQFTLEDVARSWYGAPLAPQPELPAAPVLVDDGVIAPAWNRPLKKRRKGPIIWGHAAAIVSRDTYRFRVFALGSKTAEADALRKGEAW